MRLADAAHIAGTPSRWWGHWQALDLAARRRWLAASLRRRAALRHLGRYGSALALMLAALLARMALEPYLDGQIPHFTFYIAVALAAFVAGPGASTVTALAGLLAAEWFLIPPTRDLVPRSGAEWLGAAAYFAVCATIIVMTTLTTRARHRSEAALDAFRRSEEKLRLAKEAARMGAWDWDIVTGELAWTERCKALFALPPDARVTHDTLLTAIHRDDRPALERAVREALACGNYAVEMRVPWPDGTVRWVASHGRAFFDEAGRPVRMAGMALDITDRKRAEEALRDADARKAHFLGVLSHELRNPLAPIRHSIHLLDRAPPGSPQAAHARAVLHRQTEHVSRLVDDLLDVTRVSRGKIRLQRERLDLAGVVRRTCEDLRSIFDQSGIALRLVLAPGPLWVDADPTRIAQVVGNLLQNANKFTPAGGEVTVRLAAAGDRAAITVRDTGIGVEPSLLARMFEPFAQEDRSLARTRGGLGLGLALARGLVELHGGRVAAHSEGPGRGAEFTVTLPVVEAPPASDAPQAPHAPPPVAARRVLVIEDDPDAAQTLGEALELEGHTVEHARDGATGVALAHARRPDVVLCDIGLPDLDGYEVARALRNDAGLRGTRLVALSGYAQPEDVDRAREAGFDAHLAKPAPIESVTSALAPDPTTSTGSAPSAAGDPRSATRR
jgi:signal transduction histidine kinase/ActR/RegA family two-component response regulator